MTRRRAGGFFNRYGDIDSKTWTARIMKPFGGYNSMIELIDTTDYKSITFLGETFDIATQKKEIKVYLHRFFELVKYDYTKENRPLLKLKTYLKEERFEIIFDFGSEIFESDKDDYILQLENEVEELKKQLNIEE
jgi:hypothetical protein